MTEQTALIPRDAQEALALWDAGEKIGAFELETQRCSQSEVYAVAFELIRAVRMVQGVPMFPSVKAMGSIPAEIHAKISARELDAAHSVAYVAMLKGWAPMLTQHLASGHIKSLIIQKPS